MAYIKTLKDNELIGGTDNTDVYPVSTTQALFSQTSDGRVRMKGLKPEKLEDRLEDHEEDAQELHRKAEKLVVYLNNNKGGQTLEITGEDNVITLTGSAQTETFGDEPAEIVSFSSMSVRKLTISSGSAILKTDNNWNGTEVFTLLNTVGQYLARFDVTYNDVSKYDESVTNVNLRKYFGFSTDQPSDITALGTSHFSNSVGCTVTIPASGTGFKNILFAVPNGMSISRVVQPDALNAPLAITLMGTVNRTINGVSYPYKLYKSNDQIDSSVSKRLTIS